MQPIGVANETMRLETALFNQFTKNYDLKKCLDQLEDGEIGYGAFAPPKTRVFLNLLKEFNLACALFFRDKTEKENVQDPDFVENDEQGEEKSYLQFQECQREFIFAVINRLAFEQEQRLKTEEQSVQLFSNINNMDPGQKALVCV